MRLVRVPATILSSQDSISSSRAIAPANGISLDCYLIIARPAFEKSFHKAANEKIVGSADDARNGLRQKAILGCAGVWAQRISRILRYGSLLSVAFTSFLTPGV